ncbi:TonB-dependent receptor [Pseudomonas citronellolis]|uniref:TonB-dependent receptor n=1 Tax=Pseudomonas citronellolis TaxID=53408 RepID=UPI0023E43FB2|nr:TonB-dependent receptor [Pseudomonas citronellolis]MDF3935625.1 TonB-dependent receptor [Pseudomonas citronellolis]
MNPNGKSAAPRRGRFSSTLRQVGGVGLLSLAPLFTLPALADDVADDASMPAERKLRFAIPAQPLADALLAFGQQSGLQVSVDSDLLTGLRSQPVSGQLSPWTALEDLLRGSGLHWRYAEPNLVTLFRVDLSRAISTDDVWVRAARQESFQGAMVFDRELIERLPAGNGDITSLLKMDPNVQFDDAQLSSKTPGEIDPANVSINGAKYWQNLFLVDGVSMNNDIDPAADASSAGNMTDVPGRSQGLALDTDLLDSVKVLDSNVPASYGGFNGGVIEANTRQPTRDLHGKVSAQVSRSEWTRYHIDERDEQNFENSTSYTNQPEFDKLVLRSTLEGHVTDDLGLLLNYSSKRSTIPLKGYNASYSDPAEGIDKDQTRRIDNYYLKGVWQARDDLAFEGALTYAPQDNRYFIVNGRDSMLDIQSGGYQASLRAIWDASLANVTQTFAWSRLENSRDSEKNYYKGWRWSPEKNWSAPNASSSTVLSSEGNYGDIEQRQTGLSYKLNADWHPWQLLGSEHRVQTGLELARQNVYYERLEEFQYGSLLKATSACRESDWCSMSPTPYFAGKGQAFTQLNVYEAGKIEFDTTSWALYAQDQIDIGRLTLRPGLRLDGDDYMDKKTLAPRFAAEYDLFGDGRTRFTGGANRYYGRNMFAYRLYDGRAALQYKQTRASGAAAWGAPVRTQNGTRFNQLDIPYDDEWTLGVSQLAFNTEFALKYVHRDGRDQIIRTQGRYLGQPATGDLSSTYYTYTNGGSSESDILTFTVTPQRRFQLAGTSSMLQLALDWTDVTSSNVDYSTAVSEADLADPIIQYDGKFMRYSERPADNFNRPWTARLTTITEIPQANLTWSNFLRYRAGYRQIIDTGDSVNYQGTAVDVWEEERQDAVVTWDLRLAWERPTAKDQAVFVNLDVFNVLDEVAVSTVNSTSGVPTYEVGRQFWVEVGYRF